MQDQSIQGMLYSRMWTNKQQLQQQQQPHNPLMTQNRTRHYNDITNSETETKKQLYWHKYNFKNNTVTCTIHVLCMCTCTTHTFI